MKKGTVLLMLGTLALSSCTHSEQSSKSLDFDSLQINFSASLSGEFWSEGDEVSIIATCTRQDVENYSLSANTPAIYNVCSSGEHALLEPVTDADAVISLSSDHNYKFHGIFPCVNANADISAIPVSVPVVQKYADEFKKNLSFFGSTTTISILPTVNLELRPLFSVLEFYVPNDLNEGFETTLRSLEITPALSEEFLGYIAQTGDYDLSTGQFSLDEEKSSNKIVVDFGEEGLPLTQTYTKVPVAIAPFTIPKGGLSLKFLDVDGMETMVEAFTSEKEVGKEIVPGETVTFYVSGISDGIIPVTFPVVFPMGYPNGDKSLLGYNNKDNPWLSEWVGDPSCVSNTKTSQLWSGCHGKVLCREQNQAFLTWNWGEEISKTGVKYFIEVVNNTTYLMSTFGIKGVWTGDYFEFSIPVRKFAAGTELVLTMPFYTRSGPTFWEVSYKDGDTWKSTALNELAAFEGSDVKRQATWAIPFGGAAASASIDTDQTVRMIFENEIKSGVILIRVSCVDGSVITNASNSVLIVDKPNCDKNKTASAPFYFWNPCTEKRSSHAIIIDKI